MTRAELMRHALTRALRRVHIGPKKLKLDEETRWQIAGEAVEEVRRYGGSNGFFNDTITAFKGAVAGVQRLYLLQDLSEQCG